MRIPNAERIRGSHPHRWRIVGMDGVWEWYKTTKTTRKRSIRTRPIEETPQGTILARGEGTLAFFVKDVKSSEPDTWKKGKDHKIKAAVILLKKAGYVIGEKDA